MKPLDQIRERLRYNATSQVCELTPKDCADFLRLLDEAEGRVLCRCGALLPHQRACVFTSDPEAA